MIEIAYMCKQPHAPPQRLRAIDLHVDAGCSEVEVVVSVEEPPADRFDPGSDEKLGVVVAKKIMFAKVLCVGRVVEGPAERAVTDPFL